MTWQKNLLTGTLALLLGASAFARDVLVDVRSSQEFDSGHLQGAINIPHTAIATELAKQGVGHDDHIVLYCQSGRRAGLALDTLKALGFGHVENVGGLAQAQSRLNLPLRTDR